MLTYPEITIPKNFVKLLKRNMNNVAEGSVMSSIQDLMLKDGVFYTLVTNCYTDVHPEGRVDAIVNSLGWNGFRDRFASILVYYQVNGRYPNGSDAALVADIIRFEKQLKEYVVDGYSRGFMFGLYWKMGRLKLATSEQSHDWTDFYLDQEIIEYISGAKSKIIEIDWVLLMIHLFREYFGKEKLKKMVGKITFEEIFAQLSPEQKKNFAENCLTYGQAVHEANRFYKYTA